MIMLRRLGLPACIGLALLGACHLEPGEGRRTFDVAGDPAWTGCGHLRVVLLDGEGNPRDTLFSDSLESLGQLARLDGESYRGGRGGLHILGVKDGEVCIEQRRTFEDGGTRVKVDTLHDPRVAPRAIRLEGVDAESLDLELGMDPVRLTAAVVPAYANGAVRWRVEDPGLVSLEGLAAGRGNPAGVRPLRTGRTTVMVYSLADPERSVSLPVIVSAAPPPIVLARPVVTLFLRGPDDSLGARVARAFRGEAIEWKSADPAVARVDSLGRIEPVGEGETEVTATLAASRHADQAVVRVKRDRPRLAIEAPRGAAVNDSVVFRAVSVQEYGGLTLYRWDLAGDGAWDDSLTRGADWGLDTVRLPPVGARYGRQGKVTARFQVRDGEGHVVETSVELEIGNQAPVILSLRADTSVAAGDTLAMPAHARDPDGKLAWLGWDYQDDGRFDDSTLAAVPEARVEFRTAYPAAGTYNAVFRAVDALGRAVTGKVVVTVVPAAAAHVISINPRPGEDD